MPVCLISSSAVWAEATVGKAAGNNSENMAVTAANLMFLLASADFISSASE
jgi:hypothetical protein